MTGQAPGNAWNVVEVTDVAEDCSKTFMYSECSLTQCLQFIGCKPRRSQKTSRKVFWLLKERGRSRCDGCMNFKLSRHEFESLVLSCLGDHPRHLPIAQTKLDFFRKACQVIVEKTETLIILLCGTSGSGKSTLASLVASRLGIAHVMSTDVIRNLLRGLDSDKARGYLWKSTYEEEKINDIVDGDMHDPECQLSGHFLQQRAAILERAELLVESFVNDRKESLIIEGVHLSGSFAARMMERYPGACILPFLVHISNQDKHLERFAVRAKAMTLRPDGNRYVKHLGSIRRIQKLLIDEAHELRIPQVDNTNVDRSLAAIHETVLGVLTSASNGSTTKETVMQHISDIFTAKNKGRSGKDAEARIKALRKDQRGGAPSAKSPMSSSTSIFTLHRLSTAETERDNNENNVQDEDVSDENDSEYDEIDRPADEHEGSVHELTTTQGLSQNE